MVLQKLQWLMAILPQVRHNSSLVLAWLPREATERGLLIEGALQFACGNAKRDITHSVSGKRAITSKNWPFARDQNGQKAGAALLGPPPPTKSAWFNPRVSLPQRGLVLYMRSLRQVFSCVSFSAWPASMVLFDVRRTSRRQQSGATLALTLRAAQCIKRRYFCNQRVARSPSWSAPAALPRGGNARTLGSPFHRQAHPWLKP